MDDYFLSLLKSKVISLDDNFLLLLRSEVISLDDHFLSLLKSEVISFIHFLVVTFDILDLRVTCVCVRILICLHSFKGI